VVLDHGRIVEQGRHDELVAGDTLYARMFGRAEAGGQGARRGRVRTARGERGARPERGAPERG